MPTSEELAGWYVVEALMREWEVTVVEISDLELTKADPNKMQVERMYHKAGIRITIQED